MIHAQSFNIVDLSFILVVGLSILIGVVRGATREILGIMGWLGAVLLVVYGLPLMRPLGRVYIKSTLIADSVVAGTLFVISLSLFVLLSRSLSQRIKGSVLGGLDRSFGLVFGAFRGVLILLLAFLASTFFLPPEKLPDAVQHARFTPWVYQGAMRVKTLIPPEYFPHQIKGAASLTPQDVIESTLPNIEETVKQLSILKPASSQKPLTPPTHNPKEQQDIEKLIEANEKTP